MSRALGVAPGPIARLRARIGRSLFRRRLILLSAAAVAVAVVLASVAAFVVVRNQLRDDVDNRLRNLFEQISIPQGLLCRELPPGRHAGAADRAVGSRDAFAQVVRPDGTVVRPRETRFELPVDQRALEVARGERKAFFSDATIGGVHARVYTAPLSTGDALQAVRPLEEVDSTLRDLGFALALISLGGIALAVWLGRLVARAALRPVKQLTETTEHVARTRDLSRRIRADGDRRAQPPGCELQHDARGARRSGALATPARCRRVARAAYPAHEPAHERRGARRRHAPAAGPRASAARSCRPARRAHGAGRGSRRPGPRR